MTGKIKKKNSAQTIKSIFPMVNPRLEPLLNTKGDKFKEKL